MNLSAIPFESVMVLLSAAIGLSLIIERILEIAKHLLKLLLKGAEGKRIPQMSEASRMIEDLKKTHELEKDQEEEEWDERFSNATILVEPATDPDDGRTLKAFILQLLGFAAGIILARLSGLQLFNSFLAGSQAIPPWADYLLTGLLIGGGSAPVHVLIRFITQRKITAKPQLAPAEEEEQKPPAATEIEAPAIISAPLIKAAADEWIDIPYNGGVDREKLEGVHKRKDNPNLIVYHHTAMSSQSTFEDVVRVIKNRTDSKGNHWITGYNCVITAGGSIHPFCRWDRYGNHAAGYNLRSLGLAFNGNYETNSSIPFSNPDGRMGPPRPTEAQLKAGARVVTLWTFLYGMEVDFKKAIIPHKEISNKTCPGSAFPYQEFEKWVEFYRRQWEKSTAIQERLEAFRLKPYLYV